MQVMEIEASVSTQNQSRRQCAIQWVHILVISLVSMAIGIAIDRFILYGKDTSLDHLQVLDSNPQPTAKLPHPKLLSPMAKVLEEGPGKANVQLPWRSSKTRWLMSNHKSGTIFVKTFASLVLRHEDVMLRYEQNWNGALQGFHVFGNSIDKSCLKHDQGCDAGEIHTDIIHLENDIVANFVRDPFDMVVSAYLYHKSGKESIWGGQVVVIDPPFVGQHYEFRIGMADVHDWLKEHKDIVPQPKLKEPYDKYLRSQNETTGLLAEMVRSLAWDITAMVHAFRITRLYPSRMRSFCLEPLMTSRASFEATIVEIRSHLQLSPDWQHEEVDRGGNELGYEDGRSGVWGGICRCPDGREFAVGDKPGSNCKELSCESGEMVSCNHRAGPWSHRFVSCGVTHGQQNNTTSELENATAFPPWLSELYYGSTDSNPHATEHTASRLTMKAKVRALDARFNGGKLAAYSKELGCAVSDCVNCR